MASSVAVVDARFCVPRTLPLTLTMSLALGGAVTDASGAAVLRIDAPLFGFLRRFVLADVAGRPLVSIQKKAFRWEAFRGDSWDARDLLFTARRSPIFQVRRHFSAAGVLLGKERFSVTVSPNVD